MRSTWAARNQPAQSKTDAILTYKFAQSIEMRSRLIGHCGLSITTSRDQGCNTAITMDQQKLHRVPILDATSASHLRKSLVPKSLVRKSLVRKSLVPKSHVRKSVRPLDHAKTSPA